MSDEKSGLGGSAQTGPSSEGGPGGSAQTGSGEMTFRVQPGFQFFYTLPVLLAVAVLVDALLAPAADKWLLLLLTLAIAAMSVPRGWSKVTLEGNRLALHTLLRQPRMLDLHSLTGMEASPRLGRALVLRYHPADAHGQPDPASEAVLGLPPLQDQFLLEERLQAAIDQRALH
jgi:hypothetical protein